MKTLKDVITRLQDCKLSLQKAAIELLPQLTASAADFGEFVTEMRRMEAVDLADATTRQADKQLAAKTQLCDLRLGEYADIDISHRGVRLTLYDRPPGQPSITFDLGKISADSDPCGKIIHLADNVCEAIDAAWQRAFTPDTSQRAESTTPSPVPPAPQRDKLEQVILECLGDDPTMAYSLDELYNCCLEHLPIDTVAFDRVYGACEALAQEDIIECVSDREGIFFSMKDGEKAPEASDRHEESSNDVGILDVVREFMRGHSHTWWSIGGITSNLQRRGHKCEIPQIRAALEQLQKSSPESYREDNNSWWCGP